MGAIKLYLLTLFLFLVVDFLWLGVLAKGLYQKEIGFLMTDKIRWGAAVLFYLIYILGLVVFAIQPSIKSGNIYAALALGGFFGFVCYATYDLTNLATLKGWPVKIVIYDLIWGAFISAFCAFAAASCALRWRSFFE